MGRLFWVIWWTPYNHKGPSVWKREEEEEVRMMQSEKKLDLLLLSLKMEERGHQSRNVDGPLTQEEARKHLLPENIPERNTDLPTD